MIFDAKKAIGRRVDDLKTKESAVADKEFELNEKEEALDEKIGLLARVQKVFKSWVKCLFSENKQALA